MCGADSACNCAVSVCLWRTRTTFTAPVAGSVKHSHGKRCAHGFSRAHQHARCNRKYCSNQYCHRRHGDRASPATDQSANPNSRSQSTGARSRPGRWTCHATINRYFKPGSEYRLGILASHSWRPGNRHDQSRSRLGMYAGCHRCRCAWWHYDHPQDNASNNRTGWRCCLDLGGGCQHTHGCAAPASQLRIGRNRSL